VVLMLVRDVVYQQVKDVAAQQRKTLPPLSDDVRMLEMGLDSLCIAILIANLDDEFNVSPFDADDVPIPVTFGELIAIYQGAVAAK
jgi:acyl carrier protein